MFKQFVQRTGREPMTPSEWMSIQNSAVNYLNKTKGVPPGPQKPPFQGWKPEVIQGGKGIEDLLKKGDVKKGVAPKTKLSTLEGKQKKLDTAINKEEWIAKKQRENKEAVARFEKKFGKKKTVEDFRDEGDWDPSGFAGGGVVKKFIERLFIKASNDIRQGKGKWKGLTQDQWIKQHDDLTKMMKKWEWGGKKRLPEGAEQFLGMNDLQIARAVKQAEKQVGDEKLMGQAYEEIRGGSGFTGDYKYDADILAEEYASQHGKVFADLPQDQISIYYDPALKRVSQDMLKRREAKKALKDVEEKIELQMFDPKDRLPNAGGGLAYMLGEPNTRTEALQEFGVVTDPWGMYTDPSLYAQGERSSGVPSRAEYKEGGVGQGPWTMGQAAPTPDQGQNLDTPPPQVMGTPDPLKMPQGIPSAAPKSMDPRVMQQQMMQKAMMGQQRPRMGMKEGGTWKTPTTRDVVEKIILSQKYPDPEKLLPHDHALNVLKEGIGLYFLGGPKYGFSKIFGDTVGKAIGKRQHRRQKEGRLAHAMDEADERFQDTGDYDERAGFAGGGMSRRAFMKLMSGLAALPLIGKGVQKAAPKAIKEVTKTIARDAEGVPTYVYDLIEVVKAKGTRDIIEGFKKSDYSTVHSYKGVDVIEDPSGAVRIKKDVEGGGTYTTPEGVEDSFDGISRELHLEIKPGEVVIKDEGLETAKRIQAPDEYFEGTVRPDMDGKMKDIDEFVDEMDHLDLKEIADEVTDLPIRTKKAGGGPVDTQQLIQMYMEEGLSYEEAMQAAQAASNLDMDLLKRASGGLAHMLGE